MVSVEQYMNDHLTQALNVMFFCLMRKGCLASQRHGFYLTL